MSGSRFHVHGPHDHEVEHAIHGHAEEQGKHAKTEHAQGASMSGRVAVSTAIIATVGAIFAYLGGATQADAGRYKNDAAIKMTEASSHWNYYQSKSTKQALTEFALENATEGRKGVLQEKIDRYETEKQQIQEEAKKLEVEAREWDQRSEAQLHQHHRWAQATTMLQIAIALAAMAILTRKKWLEYGMLGIAAAGVLTGIAAAAHF